MFNQTDVQVANATSRNSGAIGKNAITPRMVREYLETSCDKENTMVLDFGAGKAAAHAQQMLADGWMVTAFEFGENIDPRLHNELALLQKYDVVYASNVLNVQSGFDMAAATITQIADVCKAGGVFFANYPASPRKSTITPKEMWYLLHSDFDVVKRVGGTPSAPLWKCEK